MKEQKILTQIDVNHYMIDEDTMNLVVPGDLITTEEGFMKYPICHAADTAPTASTTISTPQCSGRSRSPTNSS
jgi:hypothetical protein